MECKHEQYEIRERIYSNGAIHYVPQCLVCGRAAGNPVPKTSIDYRPRSWVLSPDDNETGELF